MTAILTSKFIREDVAALLKLAIPIIVTGIVEASVGFFSTFFLAKLSQHDLAAGALVSWLFVTLMVILWGTLTSVSVSVSQKVGEKNDLAISQILHDAVILSCMLMPPAFLLLWNVAPIFLLFGQPASLLPPAKSYLHALACGLLPDFIWLVFMQFLIGLGHARVSMTWMLIWVPTAVICNYSLIFGQFGLPALGIAGIGWGMTSSSWLTCIWLLTWLILHPTYKKYLHTAWLLKSTTTIKELLQIGVPIGTMYCLEVGFFLALSLLMGTFGETELAGNQIALQYLNILIAIVFSTAQAVTVRMGHKLGANEIESAERTSAAGVFISITFMIIVMLVYVLAPNVLIALDLDLHDPANTAVIPYARQFLLLCGLFQLFESVRIVMFGSLRALKDTRFTLVTTILSFWLIAIPLGLFLSKTSLGCTGFWWGLVTSAMVSSTLLYWRFKKKMHFLKRDHSRLAASEPLEICYQDA